MQFVPSAPARPVAPASKPLRAATNWVRQLEHGIVRLGSLVLSIVSGHAIYWFFSAMNGVDRLEPAMTVLTAVAIGLLGYVILRALTHRLLHREKIWVYIPLCFTLVAVETVANFMKAVVGVHDDHWLSFVPHPLLAFMTIATYVVLSIMPAFTIFLAYVDMDLERAKHSSLGGSALSAASSPMGKAPVTPAAPSSPMMPSYAPHSPQPKAAPAHLYPTQAFGMAPGMMPTSAYPPAPAFTGTMNNMARYDASPSAMPSMVGGSPTPGGSGYAPSIPYQRT